MTVLRRFFARLCGKQRATKPINITLIGGGIYTGEQIDASLNEYLADGEKGK